MSVELNNNHINNGFNGEIELFKKTIESCNYPYLTSQSSIFHERILQKIFDLGIGVYAKSFTKNNPGAIGGFKAARNCGSITLNFGCGTMTVNLQQWIRNYALFLIHWLYCCGSVLIPRANKYKKPATLVYGLSQEVLFKNNSDEYFLSYCSSSNIEPLVSGVLFLVQFRKGHSSNPELVKYSRNPLLDLLAYSQIARRERARLVLVHLKNLFYFTWLFIRKPFMSIIASDYPYISIAEALDKAGLIASVVITNSDYAYQPLWMRLLRKAKSHMVWYSQNFKCITYTRDHLESDIPNLSFICVDKHWVWTENFRCYLKKIIPNSVVESVGPIIWQKNTLSKDGKFKNDQIVFTIFDISPFSDESALEFGEITNYNNKSNLEKFITDILFVKKKLQNNLGLSIKLCLKTKRGYKKDYEVDYFQLLERLNLDGDLEIIDFNENIYALIKGSDMVISYPFTSTNYVADFLHVPSIYYDPTGAIDNHNFSDQPSYISFINSKEDLFFRCKEILLHKQEY